MTHAIRKIPFLDLRVQDEHEKSSLLSAVEHVLTHGRIILGPEVEELEQRVADHCRRQYAVGVNSGTDALFLALKALGIGADSEVITTSLSWVATANAIALTGATPVFADIRDDLNIDPDSVAKCLTSRTKAIVVVHYTGKVCEIETLVRIAEQAGVPIIEDAAQAFGASKNGKPAGSFGTVACFSMNAMKVFAACGEAGMILTDRKDIHERLVALRYNGMFQREVCHEPSLNGRIDTVQAAILLRRLELVPNIIERRRNIAAHYSKLLAGVVDLPVEASGEFDCYYTYTIKTDERDELKAYLEGRGIETKIHHPILMPEQPAFRLQAGSPPERAARLVKRILSLPANEKISGDDVEYVAAAIIEFFRR